MYVYFSLFFCIFICLYFTELQNKALDQFIDHLLSDDDNENQNEAHHGARNAPCPQKQVASTRQIPLISNVLQNTPRIAAMAQVAASLNVRQEQ